MKHKFAVRKNMLIMELSAAAPEKIVMWFAANHRYAAAGA